MSKIGKKIIHVPKDVSVVFVDNCLLISGPKGKISVPLDSTLTHSIENSSISLVGINEEDTRMWGTVSALVRNAIVGVTEGYTKVLQVLGVGFSVKQEGQKIILQLGFSHPVVYDLPKEISADIQKDAKGNALITIKSMNKFLIGKVAADIRSLKKPEPYKGKGIRYFGEVIKMKAGKSAKKGK